MASPDSAVREEAAALRRQLDSRITASRPLEMTAYILGRPEEFHGSTTSFSRCV